MRGAALPDPVGRVLDERVRPNGLKLRKVTTPIGVVVIIYESRPNVTADAASLCFKSGNVTILRGGKEAGNLSSQWFDIYHVQILHVHTWPGAIGCRRREATDRCSLRRVVYSNVIVRLEETHLANFLGANSRRCDVCHRSRRKLETRVRGVYFVR